MWRAALMFSELTSDRLFGDRALAEVIDFIDYSHNASLHPGVGTSDCYEQASRPIQGAHEILLVALCYRNRIQAPAWWGPLDSYAASTYLGLKIKFFFRFKICYTAFSRTFFVIIVASKICTFTS